MRSSLFWGRGELEVADLINKFLSEGLCVFIKSTSTSDYWIDTGTSESLAHATNFIRDLKKNHSRHQGTANRLQKYILKNFTPEKMYSEFCEAFAGEQSLDIDAWLTELESGVEEHE